VNWFCEQLWLVPTVPLLAAAVIALLPGRARVLCGGLAVAAMAVACVLSLGAFCSTLGVTEAPRLIHTFTWFDFGATALRMGWLLDPLTGVMIAMVSFIGLLIFIYSLGYMAHDPNAGRFFGFLSLFAAAMLGLVISNSLLLLFICWELVGLASYLLIGFWFHKPEAAAAAKKAFITTRLGDLLLFLGMLWLYGSSGTLLFYDGGAGCLEAGALARLGAELTLGGMAASTAISLLVFGGAVGKSGQVPLHVWLPDAMEGPTPVSALIHAATMVAAGVFLMARVYPLAATMPQATPVATVVLAPASTPSVAGADSRSPALQVDAANARTPDHAGAAHATGVAPALRVVTWTGAITAVFAALIAVAQTDIKRILAYSTVSQLGYMFVGLGVGGVAVGMFHLITHAFFKALLFLGAGSVIHGCHEEQDIRRMGGLRHAMPVTFATYAVGMMALAGVPLMFCGFWSKDEILHAAWSWGPSRGPFLLVAAGALLTAFYMTRQVALVFFGTRSPSRSQEAAATTHAPAGEVHESPLVMTVPLLVLAAATVLLSLVGTPLWPWFQRYLGGHAAAGFSLGMLAMMGLSTVLVATGLWIGWRLYGRREARGEDAIDPLEGAQLRVFDVLRGKFFVDEFYGRTVVRWLDWASALASALDKLVWETCVAAVGAVGLALAWVSRLVDEFVVNAGFDSSCDGIQRTAGLTRRLQTGRVRHYLRLGAAGVVALVAWLVWGVGK
jgi:NADH-quinone oxidoreductase subunit L